MMKNIFFLFVLFTGCVSNSTQKRQSSVEKSEQMLKLDNLKWFMYALNNSGKVQAKDSSYQKVELAVVSCDIEISGEYKKHDTLAYEFDFVKHGYNSIWVDQPLPVEGIGVYDKNKYFLSFPHMVPDFARSPDSIKWYMKRADSIFRQYLQTYEGDIAPWLKEEINNRKIKQ
jgi:hypothetical protein